MNYVKKMCILRQIKQGFSGDGKALSGLIKIEQYGKNLAVEVSIINFAPLVSGEYYCLLSDGKGKTEMLSLRGKSIFNILSDLDIGSGFCAVICYVKTEVVPIAYGINGNGSYDWRAILNATLPPVFPQRTAKSELAEANGNFSEKEDTMSVSKLKNVDYDDEAVAAKNYFEEEENERVEPAKTDEDARAKSADKNEGEKAGSNLEEDGDAESVLHEAKTPPDAYYLSAKREIDGLFSAYPQDKTLCDAFMQSEWVRLKGTEDEPLYLVGAIYEEGRVQYIGYALAAEDETAPPEEIKNVCAFVPISPLVGAKGFFVIFQSAATGECVKPERI